MWDFGGLLESELLPGRVVGATKLAQPPQALFRFCSLQGGGCAWQEVSASPARLRVQAWSLRGICRGGEGHKPYGRAGVWLCPLGVGWRSVSSSPWRGHPRVAAEGSWTGWGQLFPESCEVRGRGSGSQLDHIKPEADWKILVVGACILSCGGGRRGQGSPSVGHRQLCPPPRSQAAPLRPLPCLPPLQP